MARYTEAVCRVCRRVGEKLGLKGSRCLTPKCAMEGRNRPPGKQHMTRQRRLSDRGVQLREKQKARYTYGILERQFKRTFTKAEKQTGVTKDNLLVALERRLDNIVYRLGFGDSRRQARQLVQHGLITVNGKRVDIPSYLVDEGDTVGWTQSSTRSEYYKQLAQTIKSKAVASWLSLDKDNLVGQVLSLPTPDQIDVKFDGKSIVEYYSR